MRLPYLEADLGVVAVATGSADDSPEETLMNAKQTLLAMTGIFLGVGCGPEGEHSDSRSTETTTGSHASSTSGIIDSTGTEHSIDTLRPWFGHYHLEGGFNPPLDTEIRLSLMNNFEFREDGTLIHESWWCEDDEPVVRVYEWTQTGPTSIRVEGLEGGANLPTDGDVLELVMGENCGVIDPVPSFGMVFVRGRTCWVTRYCDNPMDHRIEITLCDGPEGAECSP